MANGHGTQITKSPKIMAMAKHRDEARHQILVYFMCQQVMASELPSLLSERFKNYFLIANTANGAVASCPDQVEFYVEV